MGYLIARRLRPESFGQEGRRRLKQRNGSNRTDSRKFLLEISRQICFGQVHHNLLTIRSVRIDQPIGHRTNVLQ